MYNKTGLKELIVEKKPHKLLKLVEKINIFLLKNNYAAQSKLNIKNFILDTNSRELIKNHLLLKLTQKETEVILYLNNASKNISIQDLQKNVWGHTSELETHTVETHIYRLRKKILNKFQDNKFILRPILLVVVGLVLFAMPNLNAGIFGFTTYPCSVIPHNFVVPL